MNQPIKRRVLPLVLSFCMLLTCACKKGESKQQTTPDASFGEYVTELYRNEVVADTLTLHYSLAHPDNNGGSHIWKLFPKRGDGQHARNRGIPRKTAYFRL